MDTLFDASQFSNRPELPFGEYSQATLAGKASEHLVCSDICFAGYHASIEDNLAYDIVIHNGGMWRVQVKSSRRNGSSSGAGWSFTVKRGGGYIRSVGFCYEKDDFDILACVLTETRQIAYLTHKDWDCSKGRVYFAQREVGPGLYVGGYTLERAIQHLLLEEYLS